MVRSSRLLAAVVAVTSLAAVAAASKATAVRPVFLVVAYSLASNEMVAHTYDQAGHLANTVTAPGGTSLSWSPDGSMLALSNTKGLWIERPNGSRKRRLLTIRTTCTTVCLNGPVAVWSPDGKTLAVGGADPITTGFVRIDVSSGKATPLRTAKRGTRYSPIAYSPNGKLLAYATDKNTTDEALIVSNADGSNPRLLHQFHDHHDGPGAATWSPDSTRIAFTDDGRDPRDPRLGIVNVATAKLTPVLGLTVYDQSPAWSPDGSRLAVGQVGHQAVTVAETGEDVRPLGITGTTALWLRNGDLLFARGVDGHSFALVPGDRGRPRTLFTLPYHEELYSALREAT